MTEQARPAPDLSRLIRNLQDQDAGYQELILLAQRQHAGLVGGRSDDIAALLRDQEQAIAALHHLEQDRRALLAAFETNDAPLTIRALIDVAPAHLATDLDRVAAELRATIERLHTLNRRNGRILERSVSTLRRWQTYMATSFRREQTYGADGGMQHDDRPRAMDRAA